jgi:hypothetical protein
VNPIKRKGPVPQDLTGMRSGRLLVEEGTNRMTSSGRIWTCLCDCGQRTIVSASNIRFKRTQSCGCLHIEKSTLSKRLRPYESVYNIIRRSERFIPEDPSALSYEEFLALVATGCCFYCGEALTWSISGVKRGQGWKHSIDRVDSNLGYTKANCVASCWPCNRMKCNTPLDAFIIKLRSIVSNTLHLNIET